MSTAQEASWVPADSFGSRLIQLRRAMGLGQKEMALKCGYNDRTWNTWERGAVPRKLNEVVAAIHRATGVDRDWLMWGYGTSGPGRANLPTEGRLLSSRAA